MNRFQLVLELLRLRRQAALPKSRMEALQNTRLRKILRFAFENMLIGLTQQLFKRL